jgi:RHS repeat-associated protein
MTGQRETLLCRYQYDPLDKVAECAPLNQESIQRFYRKNRLATEIQGQVQYSVFEHEAQLLAQQQRQAGKVNSALLATDLQRSVLHSVAVHRHQRLAYSPYGHRSPEGGLISLLGFNGERRDPVTGHYLLGNGYRAFNPVLMRFNCPDSLCPFGKGGLNAYAYCAGDPVNRIDPTGHHFAAVLLSSIAGAQRVHRGVGTVISTSTRLVNNVSQGARSIVNRAVEVMSGFRPKAMTWGEFSTDIEAFKSLRNAVQAHDKALLNYKKIERALHAANDVADTKLNQLELLKQNPGTKAPVGSTEYEKLINEPTMSAFKAHQQVEALETQLKNANIDAFRAHLNVQRAQVTADIRKGN